MSDRIKGFCVTLNTDIRDDDFEQIKNAVLLIKGVISVKESVTSTNDHMNRSRIKHEIIKSIFDILT